MYRDIAGAIFTRPHTQETRKTNVGILRFDEDDGSGIDLGEIR